MRTTIELPDELLKRAKSRAALDGTSLKQFFIQALEDTLSARKSKVRRPPPVFGSHDAKPLDVLTPEQMDEAMFG